MSVAGTMAALTRFVAQSFTLATATLPTAPRPVNVARLARGMFLRLPPILGRVDLDRAGEGRAAGPPFPVRPHVRIA